VKPAAPPAPVKSNGPAPVSLKPVAPPAHAPKPTVTPVTRITVPQNPPAAAIRANEINTVVAAPGPKPITPPKPAPVVAKSPTPITALKTPSPLTAPARENIVRETPKEREPELRPTPPPYVSAPSESFGPSLTMGRGAEASFFEKIPMAAKAGVALLLVALALYFTFGKSSNKPADDGARAISVGEQGWATEWASDAAGSRKARQLTLYRPSNGMTDYKFQFAGQIESKAIGWVFRAADTKNYYAMKIENYRPGSMALTHFAVVEGRESSYSQKPLTIDARPGSSYRVTLDVTGPRFTVSIGGEPVDFWTDNRIKTGAVGFMNERDERGVSSSVQFSFPKGAK
jgi:hypothetical protein